MQYSSAVVVVELILPWLEWKYEKKYPQDQKGINKEIVCNK